MSTEIPSSTYIAQIQLWITLGYIGHDDLVSLAGDAYAHEQSISEATKDD